MVLTGPCLAIALCLVRLVPAAAPAPLTFDVDADAEATAVYHVACLADTLPCTKAAFTALWHGELRWSREDAEMLTAWQTIFTRVSDAAPPPTAAPYVGNTFALRPALQAQRQLLAALLDARSTADLQRRSRLDSADAARLRDVVHHFGRRLHPWWTARARRTERSRLTSYADRVEALLRTPALAALTRNVSAFVEADTHAHGSGMRVHLIASPAPQADAASATYIANHLVIEVTSATQVRGLAEVVAHETTHYLYDSASPESLIALMEPFARIGTPQAAAFYALENEALATAVQLAAGARLEGAAAMAARDNQETYRHGMIPRAAQGAWRALEAAVGDDASARTTLRAGFTESYIREATREFGADAERPSFVLTSLALLPTERAGRATAVFEQEIQPLNVAATNEWQQFSQVPLVFLIGHDQLREAFGKTYPDVPALANGVRGFAYRGLREKNASVFILSGTDEQALIDVVRAFARQPSLKSSGLLLTID